MRAEDHQRRQPDVGIEAPGDDQRDRDGEQQIGRERGQELRHRLNDPRQVRAQPDIDPDGRPDGACQRDQHDHAAQRGESAKADVEKLPAAKRYAGETDHAPQHVQYQDEQTGVPDRIGDPRRNGTRTVRALTSRRRRQAIGPMHQRIERHANSVHQLRPAEHLQGPGFGRFVAALGVDTETVGPGDQRAEQELVVDQDDEQHGHDGPEDRRHVLGGDGGGDIRTDARKGDGGLADRESLGGHHEEPGAGHRHHHVPDELRHPERNLNPPEARPGIEAEQPSCLLQFFRNRAQGLIEAEGHVPGLAGEDGEDRRELRAQNPPGRQRQEEHEGHGNEAQDGDRLEDIQQGHQKRAGARALGRPGRIAEGEQQREPQRDQHAQARPQRIAGQGGGIERDWLPDQARQRLDHGAAGIREQHDEAEHQYGRQQIPGAGQQATSLDRDGRQDLHIRQASKLLIWVGGLSATARLGSAHTNTPQRCRPSEKSEGCVLFSAAFVALLHGTSRRLPQNFSVRRQMRNNSII